MTRYVLTNAWHTVGINNARATLDLGAAWVFFCGLLAALWKAPSDGSSDTTRDIVLTVTAVCVVPVMLGHAFHRRIRAFCVGCTRCCRKRRSVAPADGGGDAAASDSGDNSAATTVVPSAPTAKPAASVDSSGDAKADDSADTAAVIAMPVSSQDKTVRYEGVCHRHSDSALLARYQGSITYSPDGTFVSDYTRFNGAMKKLA